VSSQFVEVVTSGKGKTEDEKKAMSTIEPGDILLVERHSGQPITIDEEQYLAIDIGQVYGKVMDVNRRK
jgi:co-chaperonin GroES (HSP10)